MNIRDKITRAMMREGLPDAGAGVRELMAEMPEERRDSVSKECQYMAACGLLAAVMVNNRNHGKKFLYRPTALLGDAGSMEVCESTVLRILEMPLSMKELRYTMASATGTNAPRRMISSMVENLTLAGAVVQAPGGSVKYPRYVRAGHCATGIELDAVMVAWARLPWVGDGVGARRQGLVPRWLQARPGE